MQFQAKLAKPLLCQATVNDVQGCALLCHEQHATSQSKVVSNHVGNGLRLAGSRRPIHDETMSTGRCHHGR